MFKPSEEQRGALQRALVVGGAVVALGLLAASISAAAGVIQGERAPREADARKAPPPVLLLRCWQEGRLLFEEPLASVPTETRKGARMVLIDRRGQSLQVFDMQSATCLVRDTPSEEYRQEGGARP
jgi:hypothetical protein